MNQPSTEHVSLRQWLAEWWETLRVAPPFSRRKRELLAALRDTDPANWVGVDSPIRGDAGEDVSQ